MGSGGGVRRWLPFGRREAPPEAWESWALASTPEVRHGEHDGGDEVVPDAAPAQPSPAGGPVVRLSARAAAPDAGETCGVAVAADGSWFASTGDVNGPVYVWDTATGALRSTLTGHRRRTYAAAISPDGRTMVTGSYDQTLRVWDVASWRTVTVLHGSTRENVAFWSLAFAPDGTWFAAADSSGVIGIWDTASWELRTLLVGHYDGVLSIAVAPDGGWLAAGDNEGRLWIWDAATWEVRTSWRAHPQYCWAVAVAPDGTWLASGGGSDHLVRTWETSGRPIATLRGHRSGVDRLAIAAGGQWLASGDSEGVRLWEPRTGAQLAAAQTAGRVHGLAVLPGDSAIVAGTRSGIPVLDVLPRTP